MKDRALPGLNRWLLCGGVGSNSKDCEDHRQQEIRGFVLLSPDYAEDEGGNEP
jgi:hypothetical protein